MNRQVKIFFSILGILSLIFAGCYTQLMTPDEYISSRSTHPVVRVDASSDISYSSNCLSCHSSAELDDRYYDMQAYGVATAHGYTIDPSMWAATTVPVYDPPYFPGGPGMPISPWWLPPPVIVTGASQDGNTGKKRADNPSRGTDGTRERSSTPVYSSPPANSGGSTSTPAVQPAAPASSVSSPTQTSTPPPQSTESRDRGSSTNSPAPTKKRGD